MKERIYSLDFLRIMSFLWVLLFHARIHYGFVANIEIVDEVISIGAVGCTTFFVLSGFMLRSKYCDEDILCREGLLRFYKKRLMGIYPVYILFLGISFLLNYRLPESMWGILEIAPIQLTLTQTWFSTALVGYFFNDNFWFLSVLFFLYLIFPILNRVLEEISQKHKIFLLAITVLVSWFVYYYSIQIGTSYLEYYIKPLFRIPEFFFGMIAADVVSHTEKHRFVGGGQTTS